MPTFPTSSKILIFPLALVISLSFLNTASAQQPPPMCGGEPVEGCPCGKLPVCVLAEHPDGFFSQTILSSSSITDWAGFGVDNSDYAQAMLTEILLAQGLQKELPCIELIFLNAYYEAANMVYEDAERSGLTQEIKEARAANDTERLKLLQEKVDKLFQEYDLGDLPWRNPDLAPAHLINRIRGCSGALVRVSGQKSGDQFTLNATTATTMADVAEQASTSSAATPDGAIDPLAKQVAGAVAGIQNELFCTCESTLERCNGIDFELSNQMSECSRTTDCCGKVTTSPPETVRGLAFGETRKTKQGCCSSIARARAGEAVEGFDEEARNMLDEIWCPGTWNLRQNDFDCDGEPNARDQTPLPPE